MDNQNKIKPEQVQGTITLGTITTKVGVDAVQNNESAKPSEEFIESLVKGAEEDVFPSNPQNQNDK